MDLPEGAKAPQDHLPPAEEPDLTDDELLADLPAMVPPNKLRPRKRNQIMKMAFSLRDLMPEDDEDDDETGEEKSVDLDIDTLGEDGMNRMLDLIADFDEFAETHLTLGDEGRQAYVEWAEQADYEQFSALLGRYSGALGKSNSSSR